MSERMNKSKKIGSMLIAIPLLVIVGIVAFAPIANDYAAYRTALTVKNTTLPSNTEYIEMFSAAGKLEGNGNGMQYLGGILIKSQLPLEKVRLYYSQYTDKEWEYIVERQAGKRIEFVEHEELSLKEDINGDDYYIVYSWGDYYSIFSELDVRGH